jgi:hypothetical protein
VPTLPIPEFPDWMRYPAVRHEASDLWTKLPTEQDPAKSEEVLRRLISDRRMDHVWRELYERRRSTTQRTIFEPCLHDECVSGCEEPAACR